MDRTRRPAPGPDARFGWSPLINDTDGEGRKGGELYEQPWIWRCAVLGE